jgi:hypothetical protein
MIFSTSLNQKNKSMALQVVTTSKKFSLQLNDFWKGLIVATITAPITIIMNSLQAGTLTFDWKNIGIVAATGLLGYLVKNFLTPAQTVVTGTPAPDATTTVVIPPAAEVKAGTAKATLMETPKK